MLKRCVLKSQGLIKSTIFTAAWPRDSSRNSTLIMAECTVAILHLPLLFHYCSSTPQTPRYGEGKATWLALHCLFHLAAWGPLEWLSTGLGTSSVNSEKNRHIGRLWTSPYILGLLKKTHPFLFGVDGSSHEAFWLCFTNIRCHWEVSEGFSHLYQLQILNQCYSKLLKIPNM